MTQSANPLQNWFRRPVIYIRLPSQGQYWPDGALNMPQNGELPVLPMTALDEITYRTPDALYNGQAVVDVIQSCIPSIVNAWKTPSIDMNSILISMRIASYGHDMEINSTCPKCSESSDYGIDLRTVLDMVGRPDYGQSVQQDELEFFFQPMTFEDQNYVNTQQFETQKAIQLITDSTDSEDAKLKKMGDIMKRVTAATAEALARNIAGIRSPAGFVDQKVFITDFLANCDRTLFTRIRDHVIKLRTESDPRPVTITCGSCQNQYEQAISFDMSNFFATAS